MDIAASVVKAEADKPGHFDAYRDRSLLVAFYGDVPGLQLWKLWISPPHPAADIVKEVSICGAMAIGRDSSTIISRSRYQSKR
jgi:hypothetical protein